MMSNSSAAIAVAYALVCVLALAMAHNVALAQDAPRDFLSAHNRARRDVHVPDVHWDDDLARRVQRHAAMCDFNQGRYGENVFWDSGRPGRAGALHAADAVAAWVAEKDHYNCWRNSCSVRRRQTCDHYTQVVWHKTARIGCAREVCSGHGHGHGGPIYYYVCKYDPAGHPGEQPYKCHH